MGRMSSFLDRAVSMVKREWKTVIRFGLVGGSSFLVKAGMYALLSRVIWNDGPRSIQNIIALGIAMVYNYTLHRFWTFTTHQPMNGSAQRYVMVVVTAAVLDAAFFYVGHDILHIYDFLVLVLGALTGALFTFSAHRLFTFHSDPYRKKRGVVQSA
jgi:putative flippase GtrA